ncbi:MAG: succinylglutamate desuccinylase/aspartoacylase family protein [Deltaproteobacteria bacterium]|nr:succinylglutamate desuccinylase/aspartoacylase family protein [Deltaproteobacteria bacterium]
MADIMTTVPQGLLSMDATEIHRVLPDLTLLHINGKRQRPLFVSCMLHGNEHSGFYVLKKLLETYGTKDWPRAVYWLFGNMTAAAQNKRHLDDQPDYNRIWKVGDDKRNTRALDIISVLAAAKPFASLDIHNNTGRNPLYSIVRNLDQKNLRLAGMFSDLSMCFKEFVGSITDHMSRLCPAITIEAGQSREEKGIDRVYELIKTLLAGDHIPEKPITGRALTILNAEGTLKINQSCSVGIGDEDADIVFEKDFDNHNFKILPVGTVFGRSKNGICLSLKDQDGRDRESEYFDYRDGKIIVRKAFVPGMITLDKSIIKSDCVCYVMHEICRQS